MSDFLAIRLSDFPFLTFFPNYMEPSSDRRKKSDKSKDTYAKYGGHSAKHARIQAAQALARQGQTATAVAALAKPSKT